MKNCLSFVLIALLTGETLAQTTPAGGAVTLTPASNGTVQPSPVPATNPAALPSGSVTGTPTPDYTTTGFARFSDSTLDGLIQAGLTNSPNLRAALSRLEEARVRVRIAQSFLLPSVRSSALITTQSLSEHRPVAIPLAADRLPRFQLNTFQLLPVDASYELDLFKRIRAGVVVADLQAQATDADYRAFRLTLAAEIARTYFLIRGNDAEQAVFRRNIQARDSTVAIARERFRVGLADILDAQRAETDVAQLRVQLVSLQRARTELVNGLAQLVAQEPATFTLNSGDLPAAVPALPGAVSTADLARRRPDLQQFERQIQIAGAQLTLQQAATRPRVTVVGSGGLLSGQLPYWPAPSSATYLLGVNASVPLYEGRRNRELINLSRQQTQTSQQTYQQAIQVAGREVETAVDNLTLIREQLTAQTQVLTLARTTERYNRERYVRGLTTYLEVLDAQRTILTAEQTLVQLRAQEVQYAVALLRAVGGDF
ncbi:TolC family protein [Rudanella lutea]|uniref:TolC family protein n=1 Tax=Rudanella lutea TaxID=451374 RepID=UPI000380A0C9|nr:TolC family protein [Rudanella lutea]